MCRLLFSHRSILILLCSSTHNKVVHTPAAAFPRPGGPIPPFVTTEVCLTEASTEYDDAECHCKPEKVTISEGIQAAVPEPIKQVVLQVVDRGLKMKQGDHGTRHNYALREEEGMIIPFRALEDLNTTFVQLWYGRIRTKL